MLKFVSRTFLAFVIVLIAFSQATVLRAQNKTSAPPPQTPAPEPRTRVGRGLDRIDRKIKPPPASTKGEANSSTNGSTDSETRSTAAQTNTSTDARDERQVTIEVDSVTRLTKVTLAPQLVFADKQQRVTMSAEYDPAQAKADARNVVDIPAEVTLKFMFPEGANAPTHSTRAEVVFVVDGRAERPRRAFFTHTRVGSTLAPPTVTTSVPPALLRRIARARQVKVQVAERDFDFSSSLLSALTEFVAAIKEP